MGRWRRADLGSVLGLLVAAAAVILTIRFASALGWRELAGRIGAAEPGLTLLAAATLASRWAAWHYRWSLTLRRVGDRSGAASRLSALLGSILVNHLIPSMRLAGGVVRARYLARRGGRTFAPVYGTVLFDTLMQQLAGAILTWGAATTFLWLAGRPRIALGVLVAGPAVAVPLWLRASRNNGGRLLARRLERRAVAPPGRWGGLVDRGREAVGTAAGLLAERPLRRRVLALAALSQLLNLPAQWLVFRALGAEASWLEVFAVVGLGTAAGMLTGAPGGAGAIEGAMIAAFVALGIGRLEAVAGTLAFRGLHYLLVLLLGLPCLLYWEVLARRAPSGK